MSQKVATRAEVRRLIADVIQEESGDAVEPAVAAQCAASVLLRLEQSGVKLVKARASA